MPMQRFPAQLDIQFGLNSYVTGGTLNQGVVQLDGYYPLPYDKVNFINLFGTAIIRPSHPKTDTPLILKEATGVTLPDSNVAIIAVPQFNRDYYKLGVGMDFVSLAQKLNGK